MSVRRLKTAIARGLVAATLLTGAMAAPTSAQDGGTMTGRVTDAETGAPIFAVAVHVNDGASYSVRLTGKSVSNSGPSSVMRY